MTVLLLTFLLRYFGLGLMLTPYDLVMNVFFWVVFGALNGMVLYWIKPDHHVGGFIGAALLGSSGALLGGAIAAAIYEFVKNMNLVMFVLLLMTVSSLFLLISTMVLGQPKGKRLIS